MRRLAALTVFALVVSSMVMPAIAQAEDPVPPSPQAVIGLIDTGINPYHKVFRDDSPRAYQYPGTYIPNYPPDAIALHLTFDADSYADAVHEDCSSIWKKVQPGRLYWFPGTRIVGAISFNTAATTSLCSGAKILDGAGHGTMTASRAASSDYGACPKCLIVSIQFVDSVNLVSPSGSTAPNVAAVKWAGDNSTWIDAQSNSWGPIVPGYDPTGQAGIVVTPPALARAVEEVSRKHPAFWAAGNGAAFRGGVLGHPTILAPHLGPSAIIVGGMDSGYMTAWTGFSAHVVSDACNDWGAYYNSLDGSADTVGSGTSSATPFAAGGAVDELLEARNIFDDHSTGVHNGVVASGQPGLVPSGPLADGVFTVAEWKQLLFHTATARPVAQPEDGPTCSGTVQFDASPVKWSDVPSQYPEYVQIGYGAVDDPARALAKQVLHGTAPLPARDATDQYFALDAQARSVLYTVYTTPPLP